MAHCITVAPEHTGDRLDRFLTAHCEGISRSSIQKAIARGEISVNGRTVQKHTVLRDGDRIELPSMEQLDPHEQTLHAQDIDLEFLFEDEYYIAIDKPPGLVVHPGHGNREGTVVNALLSYGRSLSDVSGSMRPGIVHRLDKNTSGVLIIAKTNFAHRLMAGLFAERQIEKTYLGFCIGAHPETNGVIDAPLGRSRRDPIKRAVRTDGKAAVTEYELVAYRNGISLLRFSLHTGRTHQVRVHCSHIGIPIVGDTVYGNQKRSINTLSPLDRPFAHRILKCFTRHALHAQRLSFMHPVTGRAITIESPLPGDFTKAHACMFEL
jgi:23S rRNA pseudouridine1911/1915/1917 synthase